ncbi:hypothetical protein [Burkholderia multivorans]|uniref:hypothetical protein n=1 Tax=Burkholderia multivorans TaxID=87883 RepID=UPI00403D90B0
MASDDAVIAVDQDRVGPAELGDAGGDARDLFVAVRARIAGVGNQRLDLAVRDGERVQNRFLGNRKPADGGPWAGSWRRGGGANRKPCKPWFAV